MRFCFNSFIFSMLCAFAAVADAENSTDKAKSKELYVKTWEIASNELPLMPLWYPSNMVVANKRIGDIKINASGDWSFLKNITVSQ